VVRALVVVVIVSLLVACKTDKPEAKKNPLQAAGSGSTATVAASLEDVQPQLDGGTLLQVRSKTETQMISIWCAAEGKGRDAADKVVETLRRDGWEEVSSRGAAERFGVAGKKADLRVSATVGGRDQACSTGTLVIVTVARLSAQVAIPPATEPVR
jgi:hypothetical protein